MNSFYGGKQGRTYHIVERYDAVYFNPNDTTGFIEFNPNITENSETRIKNGPVSRGTKLFYGQTRYFVLQDISNISISTFSDSSLVYEMKGMVNEFQKGGAYTGVNYGQYVLIDTVKCFGKSNKQNGLLFRRGFNYSQAASTKPLPDDVKNNVKIYYDTSTNQAGQTEEIFNSDKYQAAWANWVENVGGGAIYVGQIVGPEGRATQLEIVEWDQLLGELNDPNNPNYGAKSYQTVETPGWYKEEDENVFNDTIEAGYVNLLDPYGDLVGAHISFDIPYTILNITAKDISPYGETNIEHIDAAYEENSPWDVQQIINEETDQHTGTYSNLIHKHSYSGLGIIYAKDENGQIIYETDEQGNLVYKKDKQGNIIYETDEQGNQVPVKIPVIIKPDHPFYYDYQIAVPRGKQGSGITEIKVQQGKDIYFKTEDDTVVLNKQYYTAVLDEHKNVTGYNQVNQPNDNDIQTYYEKQPGKAEDKYFTYTEIDYRDYAEGTKTEHLGRWPYRVIEEITTTPLNRQTFVEDIVDENTVIDVHVGQLLQIQTESDNENIIAVCIKDGKHSSVNTINAISVPMTDGSNIVNNILVTKIDGKDVPISAQPTVAGQIFTDPWQPDSLDSSDQPAKWQVIEVPSYEEPQGQEKSPKDGPPQFLNLYMTQGQDYENNEHFKLNNLDYIFLADDGTVYYRDTFDNSILHPAGVVNGIRTVRKENGILYIEMNNGEIYSFTTKSIDHITYDENNDGKLIIYYDTLTEDQDHILVTETVSFDIKQIKETNYDSSTGILTIVYRTKNSNNEYETEEIYLKTIQNIGFGNIDTDPETGKKILVTEIDYTKPQYFAATYIQEGEVQQPTIISKKANTLLSIVRQGDVLYALYSDPDFRNTINTNDSDIGKLIEWTDPVTNINYTGSNTLAWKNIGPIGGQYHVSGEYTYSDLLGLSEQADFTIDLSKGFTDELEDRAGWLVTVTDTEQTKHLYAYDYNHNENEYKYKLPSTAQENNTNWYQVMSLQASMIDPNYTVRLSSQSNKRTVIDTNGNSITITDVNYHEDNLNSNGLWFVVSYGHDLN